MALPFTLVPFDPGNEEQANYVYGTFRRSVRSHWPWSEVPEQRLMNRLKRELAKPGTVTRMVCLRDTPDSFHGWVAVRPPGTVVFAFTKYTRRREGLATTACHELGVDFVDRPVAVTFWTYAAARIKADHPGYDLYFDLTGEDVFTHSEAAA